MTRMEYQYLIELLSEQHLKTVNIEEIGFIVTLKSKLRKRMNELRVDES